MWIEITFTSSDLDSSPVYIEASVKDSFSGDDKEGDDTDDQQETELKRRAIICLYA